MKIGILGLVGAGKDTFALILQEHLSEFTIDKYAAPLKKLTARVFNCSLTSLECHKFKEQPKQLDRDLLTDEVFSFLTCELNFDDEQMDKSAELFFNYFGSARAISPREFMQLFGTDVVRAVKPTAWRDYLQDKDQNLIVGDVRFANELCDVNILIRRFKGIPKPAHKSEHYAYDLQFEHPQFNEHFVISNFEGTTLEALGKQALPIVKYIKILLGE